MKRKKKEKKRVHGKYDSEGRFIGVDGSSMSRYARKVAGRGSPGPSQTRPSWLRHFTPLVALAKSRNTVIILPIMVAMCAIVACTTTDRCQGLRDRRAWSAAITKGAAAALAGAPMVDPFIKSDRAHVAVAVGGVGVGAAAVIASVIHDDADQQMEDLRCTTASTSRR